MVFGSANHKVWLENIDVYKRTYKPTEILFTFHGHTDS